MNLPVKWGKKSYSFLFLKQSDKKELWIAFIEV